MKPRFRPFSGAIHLPVIIIRGGKHREDAGRDFPDALAPL
jgi:hypothetical protein